MTKLWLILSQSIAVSVNHFLFPYLPFPISSNEDIECLESSMRWIEQSVIHGKGGSSSHYSLLKGGWTDPFPETTGYIIPTLYDYGHFSGKSKYIEMATQLAAVP